MVRELSCFVSLFSHFSSASLSLCLSANSRELGKLTLIVIEWGGVLWSIVEYWNNAKITHFSSLNIRLRLRHFGKLSVTG